MPKASIFLLILFSSCASEVINRSNTGDKQDYQQVKEAQFNVVKKKVAILTFCNESPFGGEDLAITTTEELNNELARSGVFLIDPVGKQIFGNSKEIYAGGGVKLVQLARKAKTAGINFVLFGRIVDARLREKTDEIGLVRDTKSFSEADVEIRIFDVNSNREIFTESLKGFTEDTSYRFYSTERDDRLSYRQGLLRYAAKVAVRRAIPHILEVSSKLDWVGRVAKIVGNKIYLNAGRQSGVVIGDVMRVITEGNEIYDPETGALIGVSKGEVKGTIEVIDYFGADGAVAILYSGGTVYEGDFVQLY